jgi:hypothetical protein
MFICFKLKLQYSPYRPKSARKVSYLEWLETRRCFITIALECATRRVQENQEGMNLNGTHQLLSYADDGNIVAENADTIQKNNEAPLDSVKEVGLEVNPEKTKYMLRPPYQKTGQRHYIRKANSSFVDAVTNSVAQGPEY